MRAMVLAACASLAVVPMAAQAQERANIGYDIAAQDLGTALTQLARQSNREIYFSADLTRGKRAPRLKGVMSVDQALERLLAGTGLTYRTTSSGSILVERRNALITPDDASSLGEDGDTGKNSEIVVTGSNIRGIANPTSALTQFDRHEIARRGYTTTQQLMESLPQNWSGGEAGFSETGLLGPGSNAAANNENASGVNLRGLGNTSTLVLVNGNRLAPSARGTAVDISLLPLSAIERVDVLTDGSSAVYGSDAVAGVVNFILRPSFEGVEINAQAGTVTSGSLQDQLINGTAGTNWLGGGGLLSVQYQRRDALPASERSVTRNAPTPTDILPQTSQVSLVSTIHQDLASSIRVSLDSLFTHKDIDRRFASPFQRQDSSTKTSNFSIAPKVIYTISNDWSVTGTGNFSEERVRAALAYDPLLPGYENGTTYLKSKYQLVSTDWKIDGNLLSLPGGDLKLALGGSYRHERYRSTVPFLALTQTFSRGIYATFAEVYAPLIGQANGLPFVEALDLSGAVRYDHYSDVGGTTNYRLGVAWKPFSDLRIRSTFSSSFRAPNAGDQIFEAGGSYLATDLFLSPAGGSIPVFTLSGSQGGLKPERSRSWNIGFDWSPRFADGLSIAATYYHISFRDRIITPPYDFAALLSPDVYGSLISTFASDQEAEAFLQNEVSRGALYFDLVGTGSSGVRFLYNALQQNVARVVQDGVDLDVKYSTKLGSGDLSARVNLAYISSIREAFSPTSTSTDIVNTYGNPLHLRWRSDVAWTNRLWDVNVGLSRSNSYKDTSAVPVARARASTLVDLSAAFSPVSLPNTRFSVFVLNLFDQEPPRVQGRGLAGVNFDTANGNPLGRYVAIGVRQKW